MTKTALQLLIEREIREALGLLNEGIIHLDKMKWYDLLEFLKAWNLDKAKFHVTEKMDGAPMILGVQDGNFYMRSKNMIFNSLDDISDVSFMTNFKNYFRELRNVPWHEILTKLSEKHGFEYNGTLEIEGEAIPSFDHNIVLYDEAKIGDGIFVIFNTKTSVGKDTSGRILNPEMWKDLAEEANKYSKIKFFQVPEMDLSKLEFDNDLVISLGDLVEKHGNFLRKAARTPAAKELKTKLLQRIREIGMQAKQQALDLNMPGKFGPNIEGIVIAGPDGKLVKIVDVEKFTEVGRRNWFYLKKMFNAEAKFKRTIKKDPEAFDEALATLETELDETEQEYKDHGHEMITIDKKHRDTQEQVKYQRALIRTLRRMIDEGMPRDQVIQQYVDKKIIPESARRQKQRVSFLIESALREGGNVFEGMNSVVPRALLEPSIENALELAGFKGLEFDVVGNKSKKFFNDIDIAVSIDKLYEFLALEPGADLNEFWKALDSHLASSEVENFSLVKGLRQFHVLVPLIDSSGEHMNAFLPNGDRSEEPGMIQVDVFVGNLDWMKDINSGAPESSKHKAVWRNLLFAEIASVVKWKEPGDEEDVWNRYVMDFRNGLRKRKFKVVPPSGRRRKPKKVTLEDKIVTTSPDGLVQEFFGPGTKWEDVNSYEELRSFVESDKFKFKEDRAEILAKIDEKMGAS